MQEEENQKSNSKILVHSFALQKFALGVGFGHQILAQTQLNDV
jgi:hypothetical protein